MAILPTEAVCGAKFLLRRLYRPIAGPGLPQFSAVAETADAGEDEWFWTDDNAKVLELLCLPGALDKFRSERTEIFRFVRSMCRGLFIFRRIAAPRLDRIGRSADTVSYHHALMRLEHDQKGGIVTVAISFHDGRKAAHVSFGGNYVEFSYRSRRFTVPIDHQDSEISAYQDRDFLVLKQRATLHFTPYMSKKTLGQITYTYAINSCSMAVSATATLDVNPDLAIGDVILTIGHLNLRDGDFRNIVTDNSAPLFAADAARQLRRDALGASYYVIRQHQIAGGDATALHSIPREPHRVYGIEASRGPAGRLHRVLARYSFGGMQRGARLVADEYKLLTAGGFYDRVADYAGFTREAGQAASVGGVPHDFSISYDYGAIINSFAKLFTASADDKQKGELRSLVDYTIDSYIAAYVERRSDQPNAIYSRELSFVVVAVATMYRATGDRDYLCILKRLCDILLGFEFRVEPAVDSPVYGYLMRMDSSRVAFLDCHSAALLALTEAGRWLDDPRLAVCVDRGLAGYSLESYRSDAEIIDTVAMSAVDEQGVRHCDTGFWNFKIGLTLRFFAALRRSDDPALRSVALRHRDRMELLELVMRRQLERSLAVTADGVAFRSSPLSPETNSETQPWVMLGLVAPACD